MRISDPICAQSHPVSNFGNRLQLENLMQSLDKKRLYGIKLYPET